MGDNGFNDGGWYPHDGEGKGMCTGPGCDCDERNYGYHPSSSKGSISGFGIVLCIIGGLIVTAVMFVSMGLEVKDVPFLLIIVVWAVVSTVLAAFAGKHGL